MKPIIFCLPKHFTFWSGIAVMLITISASMSTSNEFKVAASAPLPFLFTYASGLYVMTAMGMRDAFLEKGNITRIMLRCFVGLITSSIIFLSIGIIHQFYVYTILLYLSIMFLLYVFRIRSEVVAFKNTAISFKMLQWIGALSFIALFAIFLANWIQPMSSFPNMVGWDVYTHMLTVRTILIEHGIGEINLEYLPTVPYFYAASSALVGIDPYYLFWSSIYFILPVAGFSLYLLGKQLTHSTLVGIAAGLFGITIGSSNETLGYIFPYPSTFGLIITTFANVVILSTWKRSFTLLYTISSIIIYPFAIFANFIIIFVSLSAIRGRYYYLGVGLSVLLLIIVLYYGGLILTGQGATGIPYNVIADSLKRAYSSGQALALILLGAFFIYYNKLLYNRSIALIILTAVTLILIVLSGRVIAGYRLEEYTRPFIAFIMGYGIATTATEIAKIVTRK